MAAPPPPKIIYTPAPAKGRQNDFDRFLAAHPASTMPDAKTDIRRCWHLSSIAGER